MVIEDKGSAALAEKFSTYILPGRMTDPQRGIDEARDVQRIGLGGVWLSERYALKEPVLLTGAVLNAAPGLRIGTTMYAHMRHPIVTASVANLAQALSGDRFTLLLAKAVPTFFQALGQPPITFARLADLISILKRLWAGETVAYDGILGKFPAAKLTDLYEGPPPPIVFTAIGPKSLAFAGTHCDGVLLHSFLTPDAVRRSIKIVRDAAEKAGRDPASVKIIHNIVVAPDLPPEEEEAVVGGRAVTYFQLPDFGEMMVDINGWDRAELTKLRAHPTLANLNGGTADQAFTRDQLVQASKVLPPWWLTETSAIGSAADCARQLMAYLDAGADEIQLHGSAPKDMEQLANALKRELAGGS
jgi:5,10-methylenetetrahydromethanopterin reductase